jgi:hypothetical protein
MNDLKRKMIIQARNQYQQIYPCSSKKNLGDCFTVEEDRILFWFNTPDETTHVLTQELA